MQFQIRFHSSETSYKFALRHVSMRRLHLFANRPNSRSSDLHMLAGIFRANSRFPIHVSGFSEVFHFTSICRRCQGHFAIYWLSSWPTSIASRTGSSGISMGISTLGECWSGGATKVVCFFGLFISDFYFGGVLDRVYLLFQLPSLVLSLI